MREMISLKNNKNEETKKVRKVNKSIRWNLGNKL